METRPRWTPAGEGERYDPLPNLLKLPARGWRKLSPRGRRVVALMTAALMAGIAIAWPFVVRDRNAGERERERIAAQHRAASLAQLREDQRPRHHQLSAAQLSRVRGSGGLQAAAAAGLVGTQLEAAISADVRQRVAAGKLDGPLMRTVCDPVRARTREGANYNCFAYTGSAESGGRVLESGYRFSARAQLPAGTLAWCKENPRPLHPTSFVLSVPISSECR
jgi:type II secretory pathway component PulM